ncbi:MAG: DUF58 domain-containing protein [Gammaproteobacteria bacterium]|nr:DUF58 domain-containing protein [Gammaproteobacteria bacterium]
MSALSFLLPSSFRQRMNAWIARRNPPGIEKIHLHQRRLYILPTRFGYLYVMILLVLLLGSINYDNSMVYMLTFLLTALGIISMWQTHKNLLGLEVMVKAPQPVFLGDHLTLNFQLYNPQQAERYAIGLQYGNQPPVYARVKAGGSASAQLTLPSRQRGMFKMGGVTIFTRYPTGLFHAWGWLRYDIPVLIFPRPVFDSELTESLIDQPSGKNIVDTADGDDFAGLREHRPGESLRHISWKAYAQGRGMLTKTFQGHASPALWIDWSEVSADSLEGKLSQMTALVLQAHQEGRKYGLRLPGIEIAQDDSKAHKAECLQQLAIYQQPDPDSPLQVDDEE